MTQPIPRAGLAVQPGMIGAAGQPWPRTLMFPATASTTKVHALDPTKSYEVFLDCAGNSDVSMNVSSDDLTAVSSGRALYGAAKTYTATGAGAFKGYMGAIAEGSTAVQITIAQHAAATDDAPTVAALGARAVVRIVEKLAGTAQDAANVDNGTYGDYTAMI